MPSNPTPASSSSNIWHKAALSWTCSDPDPGDSLTYDLYLGEDAGSMAKVAGNTPSPYFTTGWLLPDTTYSWRVVARDSHGAETEGPVWSFTTGLFPYIKSASADPATTGWPVTLSGYDFRDGSPKWIKIGLKYLYPGDPRILSWTDTEVTFRMPDFPAWPHGVTRAKQVRVKAGTAKSNPFSLNIFKP